MPSTIDDDAHADKPLDAVRAFLSGPLAAILDEPEEGPFADNDAFLLTYEALTSLQVAVYKLSSECQQRVMSFASRDFADAGGTGVVRAMGTLPLVKEWVERLQKRLDVRGPLPLADTGLPPRFIRTCDVYELSPIERKILGAILMLRTTHAFASVKLSSSVRVPAARSAVAACVPSRAWARGWGRGGAAAARPPRPHSPTTARRLPAEPHYAPLPHSVPSSRAGWL